MRLHMGKGTQAEAMGRVIAAPRDGSGSDVALPHASERFSSSDESLLVASGVRARASRGRSAKPSGVVIPEACSVVCGLPPGGAPLRPASLGEGPVRSVALALSLSL